MGRPCGVKNFKNRTSDFKEKTHFQNLDHRGNTKKVLHGCTTAFLSLYKSIKVALKFYNTSVIWCAQSDHFHQLFWTALKSLTNYSAAKKSSIRKILYTCISTINVL